MRSLILISSKPLDLRSLLRAYENVGDARLESLSRLIVSGEWGWFAIEIDQKLANEFSDEELLLIKQTIANPYFCQLEYSNLSAANLGIKTMPVESTMLIDNDAGLVASIEEIKHRIDAGRGWQTDCR